MVSFFAVGGIPTPDPTAGVLTFFFAHKGLISLSRPVFSFTPNHRAGFSHTTTLRFGKRVAPRTDFIQALEEFRRSSLDLVLLLLVEFSRPFMREAHLAVTDER